MKIKDKLIHLLGGITEQEAKESNYNSAQIGRWQELTTLQAYMREINGEDADTWCNIVWSYVRNRINAIGNNYENNMKTYFEVGIRYDKTMEDGSVRKVTENYLLDALTFTEAEARVTEEMTAYISGDMQVVTEKITNIAEVVTTEDVTADKYYKVKHSILTIDERSGKEKKQAQYVIIQAASVDDARKRYEQYIKGSMMDLILEAVSETKYVDYFPYA